MPERREPEAILYPGAPLLAVAIEVSFPPLLDAFAKFGAFQRKHRDDFDENVIESPADAEAAEGEQRSRPRTTLITRNRERAVSVSSNQLAAVTFEYRLGFSDFMPWAMTQLQDGLSILGVERIRSVSYRYENRIRADTSKVDLSNFFKLSLATPKEAATTQHTHLYWHQTWEEGIVKMELDACPHISKTAIHLNITARCPLKAGTVHDVDRSAREAHRMARLAFEELIAEKFKTQLKGGQDAGLDRAEG